MNKTPNPTNKEKINMVQRMEQLFQEALTTRPFPMEGLTVDWFNKAMRSLQHATPKTLGVNVKTFDELIRLNIDAAGELPQLTLIQFALLANNLEDRTPAQLELDFKQYGSMLFITDINVRAYQRIIAELKKECETKAGEESAAAKLQERAAGSGSDEHSGGLKAVKAEA